jgi:hypothetical protein
VSRGDTSDHEYNGYGSRNPTRPREQYDEALEVLFGGRRRDKSAAAVRIRDLNGILHIDTSLRAKVLTAAPTMADYNALLRDVTTIMNALKIVADRLHDRVTSNENLNRPHT